MSRYRVQATTLEGLNFYHRCGRAWPRGEGFVDVEVVADGSAPPAERGIPTAGTVIKISEADFDVIQNDPQMRVLAVKEPVAKAPAAAATVTAPVAADAAPAINAQQTPAKPKKHKAAKAPPASTG